MKKFWAVCGVAVLFFGLALAQTGDDQGTGDVEGDVEVTSSTSGEVTMTGDNGTGTDMGTGEETTTTGDDTGTTGDDDTMEVEIQIESTTEGEVDMNPDFSTVLDWLHNNGLTKYDNEEEFRGDDYITRGEAAKFVNQYAQILGLEKDYENCDFSDIGDYDYTLVPHILEACSYGLLKGSDGKYMPNALITEAQAVTIVVRTLTGFLDETGDLWWEAYFNQGVEMGIIEDESLLDADGVFISRAKLGAWFYLAAQLHLQAEAEAAADDSEDEEMEDETDEEDEMTGTGDDTGTGDQVGTGS